MIRVAIISDVHGSISALDAVIKDADNRGVDKFWCLGDVIGKGPFPFECLTRLVDLGPDRLEVWLAGNHECAAVGPLESPLQPRDKEVTESNHGRTLRHDSRLNRFVNPRTYSGFRWEISTLRKISEEGPMTYAVHGGADLARENRVTNYCGNPSQARLLKTQCDESADFNGIEKPQLILVGHTHIPQILEWAGGARGAAQPTERLIEWGMPVRLTGVSTLVNPGTAGCWTRTPNDWGASYVIVDADKHSVIVTFVRVQVDLSRERSEMDRNSIFSPFKDQLRGNSDEQPVGNGSK